MATPNPTVLTNAAIVAGTVDLSNWANHVELSDEAEQVEVSAFGPSGYRTYIPGLKTATASVTFFQDFGAGAVDAVLQPLYASGTAFALKIWPAGTVTSATNPCYQMPSSKLYAWSPLNGDVGDASTIQVTFQNAGTAGLTRGTT